MCTPQEFEVYCDMETDGGGWTVFQRRRDTSVEFYTEYKKYQNGFGDLNGNFWLGLDNIHCLTASASELRVDLKDSYNNKAYAKYENFAIGNADSKYQLTAEHYSGTANGGKSPYRLGLEYQTGQPFSTFDQDNNDAYKDCAKNYGKGGWWYKDCYISTNLNGQYSTPGKWSWSGILWRGWKDSSLKFSEMKLRRI